MRAVSSRPILHNMQKLFLEALRHREQDIIRFLAILGPALAGYIWLLKSYYRGEIGWQAFIVGKVGVMLILVGGAWYSLALGYNFRMILMQLAKLEKALNITRFTLKKWPRKPGEFVQRLCRPPEIINVFRITFLGGIAAVGINTDWFNNGFAPGRWSGNHIQYNELAGNAASFLSVLALGLSLWGPFHYWRKLKKLSDMEDPEGGKWNFSED